MEDPQKEEMQDHADEQAKGRVGTFALRTASRRGRKAYLHPGHSLYYHNDSLHHYHLYHPLHTQHDYSHHDEQDNHPPACLDHTQRDPLPSDVSHADPEVYNNFMAGASDCPDPLPSSPTNKLLLLAKPNALAPFAVLLSLLSLL